MINFYQVRQRPGFFVAVVFVLATLNSCVNTGQHSSDAGVTDTTAKPEVSWMPYPAAAQPVNPNAAPITKIVVPSVKRNPRATYRQNTPHLQVSMPDFEIPTAGKGGGRKSVRIPMPEKTQLIGAIDPAPLAWAGVDSTFLSIGFDDNATYNGGYIFIPPDNHAAAGPNHVVNVVNTTISFHQKDGTLDNRIGLETFFSSLSPLTATFDPKVLYDQYENRWVVITMEQTQVAYGDASDTSRMFVAVSDDNDPNGTWYFSEFDTAVNIGGVDYWADYPGFGVDEEAVYITANLFSFGGGSSNGSRVWILEKGVGTGGFYDSAGTLVVNELDPYAGAGIATTTQVSHMFGASPAAGVGVFLVSYSGISGGGTEYVQVVRLDDPLGSPSFIQQYISLGDIEALIGGLPEMPQAGTSDLINSNDRRALDAVWRDGYLWMTTTINPNSGADSGQATAMWVKLDTSNLASLSLADSGTIGGEDIATGAYTTFPSIAVNANEDVVVGFSASAPSIYAGAYFAGRQAGDPAGFMDNAVTVKAGVDSYFRDFNSGRNRWGDYSGTAVDPVDGCFWVYNQWADTSSGSNNGGTGRWGTAYAKTCSTPVNPLPVAVDDSDSVDEDGSVDIDVLANDSDPDNDVIFVSAVANPPNGSASINPDDTIAYSPDPNFYGVDNFNYTIEDPFGGTDSATVTVTVNPLNDFPIAVDDSASTKGDDAIDIDVLNNDVELDGETLNIESTTQGAFGTVTNHGTFVTYQPDSGLTLPETDSFTYTVGDGQPGSTDTATVNMNINQRVAPTADFTYAASGPTVTFTDTSTDSDGSVVAWLWDFGDGNSSTQQNPAHGYLAYSSYSVTLTVTDDDGLTGNTSQNVTISPPCSASKSLASGQWVFLSLPCMPADPRASTVFASGPPSVDYNSRWVFYTYNSSTLNYVPLGPDDVLEAGKGYLFYSLDAFSAANMSIVGEFNSGDPYPLVTEPDNGTWNLIGNPFNGDAGWTAVNVSDGSVSYTWAEMDAKANNGKNTPYPCDETPALSACIVSRIMHKWENGSAYVAYDGLIGDGGTLAPFDAMWVRSHRGVSITLTASPAAAPAAMEALPVFADKNTKDPGKDKGNNKGGKKDKSTAAEWYVRLVVESGDYRDAGNWLGQSQGARDGLDPRDLEELAPYGSSYLSLIFTNPLFDQVDWGYTRDIRELVRGQAGEWPFVVRSSNVNGQATLSWQGESALFDNAVLVDEVSGETITIAPGTDYTFEMSGTAHPFRIIFN